MFFLTVLLFNFTPTQNVGTMSVSKFLFFLVAILISTNVIAQEGKEKGESKAKAKKEEVKKEEGEEEVPPHWHLAEKGLKSFDDKKFEQALVELEEALKYVDEFEDEDKAKVHFHYAKCIQRTAKGDDLFVMAKLHRSYSEAAKHGSGMYRRESEIHIDDYIGGMDRRYPDAIDLMDTGELTLEEAKIVLYAAETLGLNDEVPKIKSYILFMEKKNK